MAHKPLSSLLLPPPLALVAEGAFVYTLNISMSETLPDDATLVAAALDDANAFAPIIEHYESRLRTYVFRLGVMNADTVEDILQNTFLAAWRNLRGFDATFRLSTWLYRIARNQTYDTLRKIQKAPEPTLLEEDHIAFDESGDPSAPEMLNQTYDAQLVHTAIAALKPEYREILLLRYIEDVPYNEISDLLQIPMGTVATRLNRAKKAFSVAYIDLSPLSS